MINSGDEQKHLNFGNNSGDIFSNMASSFNSKSNRFFTLSTDATEPGEVGGASR
jgi:hypothetical protein